MGWNSSLRTTITQGTLVAVSDYLQPVLDGLWHLRDWILAKPVIYELGTVAAATSTSYVDGQGRLYLTPDDLANAAEIYFEAVLYVSNAANTAYAQLMMDGSAVSGSEVSSNSTTPVAVRSGNLAGLISGAGDVYFKAQAKGSSGSYNATAAQTRLIIIPS